MTVPRSLMIALLAALLVPSAAFAQIAALRAELEASGALPSPGTVAASIDGEKIDCLEVNQVVLQDFRRQPVGRSALPALQANALEKVIANRLLTRYIDGQQITVTDADVTAALQAIKNQLAAQKQSLADSLAAAGKTEAEVRKGLAAQVRLQKFLQTTLNDAELQKFFEAHRGDFDGRQLRVSHILFRPERQLDTTERETLTKKAEQVRADIEAGKTSFADAAKKYSDGPSRRQGGDLGFIPRSGVMDEAFSQAAFALEKDKLSQPVVTQFGVHLILAAEIRPGTKTWLDVKDDLQRAAGTDLLRSLAEKMRSQVKIEYTGAVSYVDPETKKLVMPASKAPAAGDEKGKAAPAKEEPPAKK